jgi:hypothetical protein
MNRRKGERNGESFAPGDGELVHPMSLRVAATLGLAGLAGETGATAEQFAAETKVSPEALRRLLDYLVTVEVFELDRRLPGTGPPNGAASCVRTIPTQSRPIST